MSESAYIHNNKHPKFAATSTLKRPQRFFLNLINNITNRSFYGTIRLDELIDCWHPMKYSSIVAILIIAVCGCAADSKTLDPDVQKLQWLDAADSQADAARAIKTGDLRLLGMATRGISIPGVETDQIQQYKTKCGVRLLEGISDVVRSDEHLRLMQKARSYALKYNAIIKTQCKL